MPIVQVNLAVSDDIYKNVMAGTFQIAGLIKDNKNIIRKHLPVVADTVKNKEALKALKSIKVIAIVATVATAVGAGAIYVIHRIKETKAEEKHECVAKFQKALQEYLEVAKIGAITITAVDNLLTALKEVENSKAGDAIMLSIPAYQLNELINSIFEYTKCLAAANAFKAKDLKAPKRSSKNSIVSLQTYLEIQKQIIERAA